jgi:hypothetical protein
LVELHFVSESTSAAPLLAAIDQAGGAQQFLPALRELDVEFDDHLACRAFFEAVQGRAAFPGLQWLQVGALHEAAVGAGEALGAALAAGVFASLKELEVRANFGGTGLGALIQAMAASPCARTLVFLDVGSCQIGADAAGLRALGTAIGGGGFPAFGGLNLGWNELEDDSLRPFLMELSAARPAPLEFLNLQGSGIGDGGIQAVMSALRSGALGSRLRELSLGDSRPTITDAAVHAVVETLVEGRQHEQRLESLTMIAHRQSMGGAAALVQAVAENCPALTALCISDRGLAAEEVDALEATLTERWPHKRHVLGFEEMLTRTKRPCRQTRRRRRRIMMRVGFGGERCSARTKRPCGLTTRTRTRRMGQARRGIIEWSLMGVRSLEWKGKRAWRNQ